MKTAILLVFLIAAFCPAFSCADDFLGAPLPPGGKVLYKSESRLEQMFSQPYAETTEFYKSALRNEKEIKFWDRKDQLYIEEYNVRPWHSITISKVNEHETRITVKKDSWTWILSTLFLRFLAVFGILIALYVLLSIVGAVSAKIALRKMAGN